MTLRRFDGSVVGAFSTRGAALEAVLESIKEYGPQRSNADKEEPMLTARSTLQARFFGQFELLCDGEILPLGRRGKALVILKYLLAHRPRPVSQDHLMSLLWPDSDLKRARWSLNSAVRVLRERLGKLPASVPENYVLLEEGHYCLCPEMRVATDVEEFDECYERGRRLEKTGRTEEAAAEYEKGVELYRGDYLLEDLYEDWTMVERERLISAYVDMMSRLALHYGETRRPQEAIRACYRILEKDRCHEDSYRLLMRCYASLGLRGRALRQYRLCEMVLGQEYGAVPSTQTHSLYENLLRSGDC
jgi:LuxR family maltose regulon positive regulatory protein